MISAFKLTKPLTFALTTLALASVTFTGRVAAQSSTATPLPINAESQAEPQGETQAEIQPSVPANVVPVDMMRSSGKWIGKMSFNDIPTSTPSKKTAASPAQFNFKPPTPGWISVLDAASSIAYGIIPIGLPNVIHSGNYYSAPPPPDTTVPFSK